MNKKWKVIVAAIVLSTQGTGIMAQEQMLVKENQITSEQQISERKSEYLIKKGEITEITHEETEDSVLIGSPVDGIRFIVQKGQLIIDAKSLQFLTPDQLTVGMEMTVILPENAPMGLSLPAMSSSQTAMIVNSSERFVEAGYFDDTLTKEENTLALNIGENTNIISSTGEKRIFAADDIKNRDAVVFYTTTTRSIPAQTTPEMVVILPEQKEVQNEQLISEEIGDAEETQKENVSVRKLAEAAGYKVAFDNIAKTVTLSKDDVVICLTVGKAQYTYNEETKTLSESVKIQNQMVYVPADELAL